jgi:hypothetical protein
MNATIPERVIESAYKNDPASARSEYGGLFRDDVSALFSSEMVEARVIRDRHELPALRGVTYHAFVDPSGGINDSMVLCVAHVDKDTAILDLVREVIPPFSPQDVVVEFCGVLKVYRVSEVEGDRYAAQWVAESFEKLRVRYRPSERNRSEIYLEFLPAIMSGQVELLDNKKLVSQFINLERRTGRCRDIIDHMPGQHDDVANGVAGALVRAMQSAGGVFGFIQYLKSVASGSIPVPDAHDQACRQVDSESLQESAEKTPSETSLSRAPCPACGSTITAQIAGVGTRCNACGHQFGLRPTAPRPSFSNLSDFSRTKTDSNPRGLQEGLVRMMSGRKRR